MISLLLVYSAALILVAMEIENGDLDANPRWLLIPLLLLAPLTILVMAYAVAWTYVVDSTFGKDRQ